MPLVRPCTTIADMFLGVVEHFRGSAKDSFRRKVGGVYTGISYAELYEQVEAFALALRAEGLSRGDRVGIMSENRLEWIVADFACMCSGLVTVPVFPILTPKQIEYIYNNAEVRGVIASNTLQLGKLMKIAADVPTLKHIVVMQPDALEREPAAHERGARLFADLLAEGRALAKAVPGQLERMAREIKPDDLATLIYTSGTTGNPKGVMLTHGNYAANVTGAANAFPVVETDVMLSYLPLCHSFERTTGYYTCFGAGATIAFAESIETVPENLLEVRPTMMTSVPRLFERIKTRVEKGVASGPERDRKVFHWAMRVGVERFRRRQSGRMVGPVLALKNAIADALVFTKVRARVGGNVRMFVSGGAALSNDVAEFFFALGLRVIEGYGLTEASPVVSANPFERQKLGTVGKALGNVELAIAADGEILTRGPHVMKGYYKDPEATAEAIDAEGWLHTGDIGVIDEDGYLKITDRKKHLFVSSGGKNIAPAPIEGAISASRFVDQIMLIGDNRPFITALIVPDVDALREVAGLQGVTVPDLRDPSARDAFLASEIAQVAVEADIKRLQRDLSPFERVRRFELIGEPFSVDNGMLTPTLKVKRAVVEERYRSMIDGMYEGVEMD